MANETGELLTIEEVAKECRVTTASLYSSRYRGIGPRGIRMGKRLLFRRSDVDAWIESRREPATGSAV